MIEQELADAFSTLKNRVAEALSEEYETTVGLDDFKLKLELDNNLIGSICIFEPVAIPFWTPIWKANGIEATIETMKTVSQQSNYSIYQSIIGGIS